MQKLFQFLMLLLSSIVAVAQTDAPPFWDEIQAFKKTDSIQAPPNNAIVFTGSSSFRLWTDVQKVFPKQRIINRAFGGSSFPDLIRYADDVIFKYQPRKVVIYCGDNDLASSDTVTAQTVYQRFVQLFTMIRSRMPNASVAFVSIKPSPSRAHLMPEVKQANALIKNFLAAKRRTAFVDVFNPMLGADGKPRPELFLEDSLHMNSKGYEIWQRQLRPALRK
jgi:lysophospholipase L1-like esterase